MRIERPYKAAVVPEIADLPVGVDSKQNAELVAAIDDLVRFAGRYDVSALAHAAIAHRYFSALTAYRDGDVDRIVTGVAEAAMSATGNGRELALSLGDIRVRTADLIRTCRVDQPR